VINDFLKTIQKNIGSIMLLMGTFFNPFGFDALFALVMKWTGSYWTTDLIFYCISGSFFGAYFLFFKKKNI